MSNSHIKNAIKLCKRQASIESFSCDSDMWECWVEMFSDELYSRSISGKYVKQKSTQTADRKKRSPPKKLVIESGANQQMICHCGREYKAKTADLKRGWGLSCSIRCASIRRKYKNPNAKSASK